MLQKRTLDEIKRRLGILSKQWEEGKLSQPVQTEMTKLTLGKLMLNTPKSRVYYNKEDLPFAHYELLTKIYCGDLALPQACALG